MHPDHPTDTIHGYKPGTSCASEEFSRCSAWANTGCVALSSTNCKGSGQATAQKDAWAQKDITKSLAECGMGPEGGDGSECPPTIVFF